MHRSDAALSPLLLLVTFSSLLSQASPAGDASLPPDALSLLAFKSSADLANGLAFRVEGGNRSSDWPHCRWPGVQCSPNGRVVRLVLESAGLNGSFPNATLGRLDQLRLLSLKGNALAGPVPDLSGLANLKALFLDRNAFSGPFPASVLSLHRLRILDLSHNNLSGGIPAELASLDRLLALRLEENHFDGLVPPFNQSSLKNFNVSGNDLSGPVPATPVLGAFGASAFADNPGLCGEVVRKDCGSPFQFFRGGGGMDGFGAEFTTEGAPVELPENVVPGAFREWGVQVFDWQTQCPTLAESKDAGTALSYKLIKLLPTVGCEADAATRHSVEERAVGGSGNLASAFGYDSGTGSYVAIWPVQGGIELEHCLVDPRDREARLRVVQVVRRKRTEEGEGMKLEKLKVFSEHWDGPFRNGELLGGCAIRNSAFASTAALGVSEVVGLWQGTSLVAAKLGSEETDILHELVPEKPCNTIRVTPGLVPLPKQLWCSFKETEDDETLCEVGWLMDPGTAMTSRCIFSSNGVLKEMAIGSEILSSKGT